MSANPPKCDWFDEWVDHHCTATAAGPEASRMLQTVRGVFVETWRATASELVECTRRLVVGCRVPKWPNEHSDAVGKELREYRRDVAARAVAREAEVDESCPLCAGCGWAEVPHPRCVYHGQLAADRETGRVYFTLASCRCPEGLRQARAEMDREARAEDAAKAARSTTWAKARWTLDAYTRFVRGADGPAMAATYRRQQVERSRADGAGSPLAGVFASIVRKYGIKNLKVFEPTEETA